MVAKIVTEKDLKDMRRYVSELRTDNKYLFAACEIIEDIQELLHSLHFHLKRKQAKRVKQKGEGDEEKVFSVPLRKTAECMSLCRCKLETELDSIDGCLLDEDLIENGITDKFWMLTSEVLRIQNVLEELISSSVEKINSTMQVVERSLDIDYDKSISILN